MIPKILAHRTAMAEAPENSLAGLTRCFSEAVEALECDVSFTKDGKAVVWANSANKFLKQNTLPVSGLSLKEIQHLERKDCLEKVLTIEDVWKFIAEYPQMKIFFDVKFSNDTKVEQLEDLFAHFTKVPSAVIRLVEKEIIRPAQDRGISHRIGLVSFMGGAELLRAAKKRESEIATSLIIILPWLGRWPFSRLEKLLPFLDSIVIGWKGFNQWKIPPWNLMLDRIVSMANQAGKKVEGGVANTEEEVQWVLKNNFHAIWTDNPLRVKSFLLRREK